jgi:hypothetical protein
VELEIIEVDGVPGYSAYCSRLEVQAEEGTFVCEQSVNEKG